MQSNGGSAAGNAAKYGYKPVIAKSKGGSSQKEAKMKVYQLSDRSDMYASSVASNGRRILESPKLKSGIAKTVIVKLPNGLQSVTYLDKFGKELISLAPAIEGDKHCDFPKIGEIEYDEN